jgi:hypothetical protein
MVGAARLRLGTIQVSFLRRHVVSITATLIALAVGIALGGGPLAGARSALPTPVSRPDSGPVDDPGDGFGDRVFAAATERIYAGGLADRTVAVLSLPGASTAAASAIEAQVEAAGGEITALYTAGSALVDPGQKTLVDGLGEQLAGQLSETSADEAPYDRIGQLIGLAVAGAPDESAGGDGEPPQPSAETTTVGQSLAKAELISSRGEPTRRASRVLVLLGKDTEPGDDAIYRGLLSGLARQSGALVVAASSDDGVEGRLARLRGEEGLATLATVDGVETVSGQVTAVLALTEWPDTRGGSFGASGADGAVPLG